MEHSRRINDHNQEDITALIKEANDPRDRAMLIVLSSLNESINACTYRLNNHLDSYAEQVISHDAFVRSHDELVNRSKGSWQVISVVLAIAQLVIIAGFSYSRNEIKELYSIEANLDKRVALLEGRNP